MTTIKRKEPWDKDWWENEWHPKKPCTSPSHNFPSHLYVPPGSIVTHTCPTCGHKTTVRGREVFMG